MVAGIVVLTGSFTSWWALGLAGGGTVGFFPGDYIGGSIAFGKEKGGAETYQKAGLGAVAALYEAVLAVVLVTAAFAIIAGVVGMGAERGRLRGRARGSLVGSLGLLAFLMAVILVIVVGAAQPGQLDHASFFGLCTAIGNHTSPCSSFVGSTTLAGVQLTWGPGYGFYATIFGGILALGGAITWWSAREELWEEEAEGAAGPRPRFGTSRPIPLTQAGRRPGEPPGGREPVPGGTYSARRSASASTRYATYGRPRVTPATPRPSPSGGDRAVAAAKPSSPSAPTEEAPTPPALDLSAGSEIEVIAQLKAKLDAGLLSPDEYAQGKARLLAIPAEAFPMTRAPGGSPQAELHDLDALRDSGAISGPEYLQLRRRLLLRA